MPRLSQNELDEIYAFAVDLGKRAGKLLLDGVEKRIGSVNTPEGLSFTEKDNAVDIVTQTDEGTEASYYFNLNLFHGTQSAGLMISETKRSFISTGWCKFRDPLTDLVFRP